MTKDNFKIRFIKSIEECVKFAKRFIYDELPEQVKINLYRRDKIEKFSRLNVGEALERLYKSGAIPKWIDIGVVKVDGDYTIVACTYSDIFISDDSMLQFSNDPLSPFSISSPPMSKRYQREKKFNLEEFDEEKGWPKKPSE